MREMQAQGTTPVCQLGQYGQDGLKSMFSCWIVVWQCWKSVLSTQKYRNLHRTHKYTGTLLDHPDILRNKITWELIEVIVELYTNALLKGYCTANLISFLLSGIVSGTWLKAQPTAATSSTIKYHYMAWCWVSKRPCTEVTSEGWWVQTEVSTEL